MVVTLVVTESHATWQDSAFLSVELPPVRPAAPRQSAVHDKLEIQPAVTAAGSVRGVVGAITVAVGDGSEHIRIRTSQEIVHPGGLPASTFIAWYDDTVRL